MEENVREKLSPDLPISIFLDENLNNIKIYTDNSSDVIIKSGAIGQNRIAVLTCEGMADTDTLAELIYDKLNAVGNYDPMPPEELMSRLFNEYLIAAEQLGRCCRMVEFEPIYVDVIIKRWEELTQQKAVRIGNILDDKQREASTLLRAKEHAATKQTKKSKKKEE